MFIDNKYTKTYYRLIDAARGKTYNDTICVETHHIIPRSLGGSDDAKNLITFSAREHFVVHLLLTKMVVGEARQKMHWALHRMTFSDPTREKKQRFTSGQYELARKLFVSAISGPQSFRTDLWREELSATISSHWENNDARRKAASEYMKLQWKTNREKMVAAARVNGKHSLHGRRAHNITKIEYYGNVYYGWDELRKATNVTKDLYRKYYMNGIDPTPRIGTNGRPKRIKENTI